MDAAEDDWTNKEIHLDLSGFQAEYISSRLYDLAALHTLNLENNRITKLSDQFSYISKYDQCIYIPPFLKLFMCVALLGCKF